MMSTKRNINIISIIVTLFRSIRLGVKIFGIISLYCICAFIMQCNMDLRYGNEILERQVSPDQSWVALINRRFWIENLLFTTSVTDTVWLVKSSEEEKFMHELPQNYDQDKGAVIRHSRSTRIEDRPLVRWLSIDQLEVTAPVNVHGSYIILSRQPVGSVRVIFSFEESYEAIKRRKNVLNAGYSHMTR